MIKKEINGFSFVFTEKSDWNILDKKIQSGVCDKFWFDKIIFPKQEHTNKILDLNVVNENLHSLLDSEWFDWVFWKKENLKWNAVWIYSADCFPVFVFWKNEFTALHCWWRPSVNWIINNTFSFFTERNLEAFIWPWICSRCYEVSFDYYKDRLNDWIFKIFFSKSKWKFFFDLKWFIICELKKNWVKKIHDINLCTKHGNSFFSYRNWDKLDRFWTFITS